MAEFLPSPIGGVFLIRPRVFSDERGYFFESFSSREFGRELGEDLLPRFVQDNESMSVRGVVRGLHYQMGCHAQAKLVRVVEGEILDIALDLRPDSPTFGRHYGVILSSENKLQLFIPRGFAHGFGVLSARAIFQYKCDNYYCRESEASVLWNDPALGIDWMIPPDEAILSPKDQAAPLLRDAVIRW